MIDLADLALGRVLDPVEGGVSCNDPVRHDVKMYEVQVKYACLLE